MASRVFDAPIALISLVDLERQWFMSNRGLGNTRETLRNQAFYSHAILTERDIFIVPDTTKDSRFMKNPLVLGKPVIRFYAGTPLMSPKGQKMGTLCIIDQIFFRMMVDPRMEFFFGGGGRKKYTVTIREWG